MPTEIDSRKVIEQRETQVSENVEYSLIDLADESESEITWIKLHQMFDK